jgi:hypothetical protein
MLQKRLDVLQWEVLCPRPDVLRHDMLRQAPVLP